MVPQRGERSDEPHCEDAPRHQQRDEGSRLPERESREDLLRIADSLAPVVDDAGNTR
jgi:hypothetical protein